MPPRVLLFGCVRLTSFVSALKQSQACRHSLGRPIYWVAVQFKLSFYDKEALYLLCAHILWEPNLSSLTATQNRL